MDNFQSKVERIKSVCQIDDYIESCGIELKTTGSRMVGLCPFHDERTPSFNVNTDMQSFYCFGCREHGDIISFAQKFENLSFMEALEALNEKYNAGVDLTRDSKDADVDYSSLYAIVADTWSFFQDAFDELEDDSEAIAEIERRGLDADKYGYGYAPQDARKLYSYLSKEKGYSDELIEESKVCRVSKKGSMFASWSGRLMFAMKNKQGKVVGFSGRKLFEDDAMAGKYVNSSASPVFDKSKVLFNIEVAKKKAAKDHCVFVVEGQFDVVAMSESGMSNVVASSGTAFSREQAVICSRLVGNGGKVVFCFDGDAAGKKAAVGMFSLCTEIQKQAYVVMLPEDMDPCDYRKKNGSEALVEYVENNQVPAVDAVVDFITSGDTDSSDTLENLSLLEKVADVLSTVENSALLHRAVQRASTALVIPVSDVKSEVKNSKSEECRKQKARKEREKVREESSREEEEEDLDDEPHEDEPPRKKLKKSKLQRFDEMLMERADNDDVIATSVLSLASLALSNEYAMKLLFDDEESGSSVVPEPLMDLVEDIVDDAGSKRPQWYEMPMTAEAIMGKALQERTYTKDCDDETVEHRYKVLTSIIAEEVSYHEERARIVKARKAQKGNMASSASDIVQALEDV